MQYASLSPIKTYFPYSIQYQSVIIGNPTQITRRPNTIHMKEQKECNRNTSQQTPPQKQKKMQQQSNQKRPYDSQLAKSQPINSSLSQINPEQLITIRGFDYTYIGQVLEGKKHGVGTYYDQNNQIIYEGQLHYDKFHGFGKLYKGSQLNYQGQFENNEKHGSGTLYEKNGNYFIGNFQNNQKNGIGVLYNQQNQAIAMGQWKNDKLIEEF